MKPAAAFNNEHFGNNILQLPVMIAITTTVIPKFLNNYYLMEVSTAQDIIIYNYNLHEYIDVHLKAICSRHNGPASLSLTTVTDVATLVYLVDAFRSSSILQQWITST